MASLLEKVQILISANLHQLVDQALQSNSVAVYNYYIREIENNLEKLDDAVATVGGQVKTIRCKADEYQAQTDRLDRDIDLLFGDGTREFQLEGGVHHAPIQLSVVGGLQQ